MSNPSADVIVIGAGIIGVSSAVALQGQGLSVVVLDRKGVAAESSFGNAGAYAFSEIIPLATPGIMRKAPKWLFDPTGPLSIPPGYWFQITPWLARFWRASRKDRYDASVRAQAALMEVSRRALDAQVADAGAADLFHEDGQLLLYERAAAFEAAQPEWKAREAHGIPVRLLNGPEEIADIQPGISPRFVHGGFTPVWRRVSDPAAWTRRLGDLLRERGGRVEQTDVRGLSLSESGVTIATDAETLTAPRAVVAAGAWSHRLARTLGHRIPLETERGYHTTLPAGAFDVRTQLSFCEHGFVVTRIGDGVRVAGGVELGGLKLKPNYRRARAQLAKAKTFLPGLKDTDGTEWMGFRPSLPDSLPVIGPADPEKRVIYAFGHGHLGLTQSAGTGALVADIVSGTDPGIDLKPFRFDRF